MAAREFSKVSPAVWRSKRFLGLSDLGKIGYLYVLSNAHVTSAGVYELPPGYACSDLDWTADQFAGVVSELVQCGLIDHDPEFNVILIERWFKHCPPANGDHATGTRRRLEQIESARLREKAVVAFDEADAIRVEREAQKAAEKAERDASRKRAVSELIGSTSSLMNSRIVRGGHA